MPKPKRQPHPGRDHDMTEWRRYKFEDATEVTAQVCHNDTCTHAVMKYPGVSGELKTRKNKLQRIGWPPKTWRRQDEKQSPRRIDSRQHVHSHNRRPAYPVLYPLCLFVASPRALKLSFL